MGFGPLMTFFFFFFYPIGTANVLTFSKTNLVLTCRAFVEFNSYLKMKVWSKTFNIELGRFDPLIFPFSLKNILSN